ncbi:hypothetical protein [uncultured Brevibacillus sp.]|uniref:hypothetical protein n=1 Tax=uncultured Brevibacillus sp. TaxID=169970 RepID=UPI002597190D|nr:hypothetical protein [uncultured Brevibacillus sp.]
MSYMEFKPLVKKMNLKPKGVVEIILESTVSELKGNFELLSSMLDKQADVSLDSLIVNYNVAINTNTNKPVINYKVDDTGIVQEVKPEGEQLEAELGLPKEKIPTKEEQKEAERSVIDDFIREGFAPQFDDLPYDFQSIISRKQAGETYMKIATELEMSSGKIVELVDEYRSRVAPMALKWDEWRKGTDKPKDASEKEADKPVEQADTESKNPISPDDEVANDADQEETEGSTPDPEQPAHEESGDNTNEGDDQEAEKQDDAAASIDTEKIEEFILSGQAPVFDKFPFDFQAVLQRKREGETWIKIAASLSVNSTKIQADWREYKKLVAEHMAKQNGEEPGAA